jgi:lipopolysaccharide cholinephosphotransferase
MEANIAEVHQEIKKLIAWFKYLCEKNNLRYFMMGGTLLGAIRYKGFIPWDDDADFGMPLADFKKVIQILKKENSSYRYLYYDNDKKTTAPFLKIINPHIEIKEIGKKQIIEHLFIDVFPVCFVGDSYSAALKNYKKYHLFSSLLVRKYYTIKSKKFLRTFFLKGLSYLTPKACLIRKINKLRDKFNNKYSAYCSDLDGSEKGIVKSYIFSEFIDYQFEGMLLKGTKFSSEYLTHVYGDYLTPPEKSKQYSSHICYYKKDDE